MVDLLTNVFWKIAEVVAVFFYIVYIITGLIFMVLVVVFLAWEAYHSFRGKTSGSRNGHMWFEEYRKENGH